MNLTKTQQEKLTLAIQAALGTAVILLSVFGSAKVQTAPMKKLAKKEAKQAAKLKKTEYCMQQKLLKEKYRTKLQKAKSSGRKSA